MIQRETQDSQEAAALRGKLVAEMRYGAALARDQGELLDRVASRIEAGENPLIVQETEKTLTGEAFDLYWSLNLWRADELTGQLDCAMQADPVPTTAELLASIGVRS